MKLDSMEELFAFNTLLDRCCGQVWIVSPSGRRYDLTESSGRLKGLSALTGDDGDAYEIYARKREDASLLLDYLCARRDRAA